MSIPNMITLVRIILTPIFIRFYMEGAHGTAMAVLAAAALSDMLDGAVARRFNLVTSLGKVLDPVADKLLQLSMLLCLMSAHPGIWPLMALHLLRELTLGVMGLLVYRQRGKLIGSHWYGKLCTAVLYGFLGMALWWKTMPAALLESGQYICAGLILYCLFRYAFEYIHLLKGDDGIIKPT